MIRRGFFRRTRPKSAPNQGQFRTFPQNARAQPNPVGEPTSQASLLHPQSPSRAHPHGRLTQSAGGSRAAYFNWTGEMGLSFHTHPSKILRGKNGRQTDSPVSDGAAVELDQNGRRTGPASAPVRNVLASCSRATESARAQSPAWILPDLRTHPAQHRIVAALRALPAQAPQIVTRLARSRLRATRIHSEASAHRSAAPGGPDQNGGRAGDISVLVRDVSTRS